MKTTTITVEKDGEVIHTGEIEIESPSVISVSMNGEVLWERHISKDSTKSADGGYLVYPEIAEAIHRTCKQMSSNAAIITHAANAPAVSSPTK